MPVGQVLCDALRMTGSILEQVGASSAHFCVYAGGMVDWTPASLREAREARGWSQRRLAEAISASPRSITSWEAGTSAISRRYQRALDAVFSDDHEETAQQSDSALSGVSDGALWAELQRRYYAAVDADGARTAPGTLGQLPDGAAQIPPQLRDGEDPPHVRRENPGGR